MKTDFTPVLRGAFVLQREKLVFGLLFALTMAILGLTLFGRQGLREVRRLKDERARLNAEISQLRERRLELQREIADLRQNPKAIEALARKDLGMVRKGETVILLRGRDGERR